MLGDPVGSALVEIWSVDPGAAEPSRLRRVLDRSERDRAAALPTGRAGPFVLARALLRGVLAVELGLPAATVALDARCPLCGGAHGQVRVRATGGDASATPGDARALPYVSLTRTGPVIIVALSRAGPVGVDVASLAEVVAARLDDVALSEGERDVYRRLPPEERPRSLATAWVRKEAVLKALGVGLRIDPARIEIEGTLARVHGPSLTGATVHVTDIELGTGVHGAVALADQDPYAPGEGILRDRGLTVVARDGAAIVTALASD